MKLTGRNFLVIIILGIGIVKSATFSIHASSLKEKSDKNTPVCVWNPDVDTVFDGICDEQCAFIRNIGSKNIKKETIFSTVHSVLLPETEIMAKANSIFSFGINYDTFKYYNGSNNEADFPLHIGNILINYGKMNSIEIKNIKKKSKQHRIAHADSTEKTKTHILSLTRTFILFLYKKKVEETGDFKTAYLQTEKIIRNIYSTREKIRGFKEIDSISSILSELKMISTIHEISLKLIEAKKYNTPRNIDDLFNWIHGIDVSLLLLMMKKTSEAEVRSFINMQVDGLKSISSKNIKSISSMNTSSICELLPYLLKMLSIIDNLDIITDHLSTYIEVWNNAMIILYNKTIDDEKVEVDIFYEGNKRGVFLTKELLDRIMKAEDFDEISKLITKPS